MNKAQLVELVAARTKTTKTQSESILDATLAIIQEALKKGDEVKLVGFGTFSRAARKPRQGRNPKTGELVKIPSGNVPRFKAGKDFKDTVK
ncbi:DNA-binding protein HU-alpha [compost metagenome]